MLQISEAELMRNFQQFYIKMDRCRDATLDIKERIIRMDYETFEMIQPADARTEISNDMSKINRQIINLHYTIQNLDLMTDQFITKMNENTFAYNKYKKMMSHVKKRFEYAYRRHCSNIDLAYETLNIITNKPVLA